MKIISFGWTWPAFVAGVKTVTRRNWTPEYAIKFHTGDICQAYDKSPRCGGKKIGLLRLTCAPRLEEMCYMDDEDYAAEGFEYLNLNRHLLPKSMPYDVSGAGFDAWRKSGDSLWVIRFERVL